MSTAQQIKSRKHRDTKRFSGNREQALIRDSYTCQRCGMNQEEHIAKYDKGLTVHHIDGKGLVVSKEERNNDLSNLLTLCFRCHAFYENYYDLTFKQIQEIEEITTKVLTDLTEQLAIQYGVRNKVITAVIINKERRFYKNRADDSKFIKQIEEGK